MQRSNSRRRLLSAAGSIGLVGLAGCSGVLGGNSEDDDARPANESDGDADGNASDGDNAGGDESSSPENGDAADDGTPPMPEPVDWTDEERGTVSVGPDGDAAFEPDAVRIEPGTTVRWLWEFDSHNVVPVDQPAGTDWHGEVDTYGEGHSDEFTFETPGTYEYVCEPHEGSGMRGYIVVTDDQR